MIKWLADVVFIGVAGFVGSVICLGVERKQLARMTVFVAVMLILLTTIEGLAPVIQAWHDKIIFLQNMAQKVGLGGK